MLKWIKYFFVFIIIVFSFYLLFSYKFKYYDNAVYSIKTYRGNSIYKEGNGFVYKIDKYAYIITNYHVISDSDSVSVYLNDKEMRAEVLNYDEYNDLAIILVELKNISHNLKINGLNDFNEREISIVTFDRVIKGQVIDYLSSVTVNFDNDSKIIDLLKIKADISEGDSGSPVLDSTNHVIGIVSMVDVDDERFAYVIPLNIEIVNELEVENIH